MLPISVKCPACFVFFPRETPSHACPNCGFVKPLIIPDPAAFSPVIKCPYCDITAPKQQFTSFIIKHIKKSHPDKAGLPILHSKINNSALPAPNSATFDDNRPQQKKDRQLPPIINKSFMGEPRDEICPRCDGTGGIRQGCDLCNGRGWVSTATRQRYQGWTAGTAKEQVSRVSNADYLGSNPGANFRDFDGRIGSNPTHDDYGEEGSA